MSYYLFTDLENEENAWYTDFDGVKAFLSNIFIEDEEMVLFIYSDEITIEGLQEISEGAGFFLELEYEI